MRDFKVYSDNNEKINVRGRESSGKTATKPLIATRKSLPVGKGVCVADSSALKGYAENSDTSKKKRDSPVKVNVGRKVLADVSNIRSFMLRNRLSDGVKPDKIHSGKNLYGPRVSLARSTANASMSSRKPVMGTMRTNQSQVANPHNSNRVDAKGLKIYVDNQKIKGQNHESFDTDGRKIVRKPLMQTRKSLPVTRGAIQVDSKGNMDNSENVKVKVGRKVVPYVSNERSYLQRSRASDGFISMKVKTEGLQGIRVDRSTFDASALSKKPLKPIGKSARRVSGARMTSKSTLGLKKPISATSTSSKSNDEVPTNCLPKNIEFVIPRDHSPKKLSSDGNSYSSTNATDIMSRAKFSRRKSFTSSLVARSEVLEVCAEVIKHEELPLIDDNSNHLEVAEYVDDIYQYYWVMEAENPLLANYMAIQTDITPQMRGILINWLIEVHLKFDLMQETLFLMVMLFDRFLSTFAIKKNDMQLVGLTALLLASKYEDFWHPKVKDLISIAADSYTRDHMLSMEKLILKKLMFRLNAPTPYVFMLRFLKASQSDAKLEQLAFYLIELCLVEYEALKFKPSLLCASAIYVARCTLQKAPAWTPLLGKHSHYEEPQLRVCANMIMRFHKAAGRGPLKVAYEKYMRADHNRVAAIKALDRLPQ
ncbi:Cyclin [Macleaya cordata]|uniref:Cyclin n=1 Tax=Macleaya cordata TaxID=56857 RepID=A0A200QZ07_MACCD|nr:Cyclin [Macleaya cordata]